VLKKNYLKINITFFANAGKEKANLFGMFCQD